jgi:ferredoxin-NAD(P)+ reductase (naphthalene dioxygenase ferredoxin-specific)
VADQDAIEGRAFRIKIPRLGKTIDATSDQTILDCAQRNDIDYPCGCETGICGACKTAVLHGEVEMLPHSAQALTPSERDKGMILACRSLPRSDLEIAWIDSADPVPQHARQRVSMSVDAIDCLTTDIVRIRLRQPLDGAFAFTPGQSVNLASNGLPSRPYSMANQPGEPFVEFHIRKVPNGRLSSHFFDELVVGDVIDVDGPFGASFLRVKHEGPIIALAGGSGLAPVLSVLVAGLRQKPDRPALLLHGVRTENDLYYRSELEGLKQQYPQLVIGSVLSDSSGSSEGHARGMLADMLPEFGPPIPGAKAYIAGPPIMVETCVERLISLGMDRSDCHADPYLPAD